MTGELSDHPPVSGQTISSGAVFRRRGHGHTTTMIGQLATVVFDARDPAALAGFYRELLGATTVHEEETWVTIEDAAGRRLSFQRSPEHEPPRFPDAAGSQQLHVDIRVDDVDKAEREVLALGAERVPDAVEDNDFRVFRDPAGHTFCLIW